MKQLKELSKILTSHAAKRVSILFEQPPQSAYNYIEVAAAIASDEINSEEEIAEMISADKNSGKYWMFKSRFIERLLNTMLVIDIGKDIPLPYQRAMKTCGRNRYCVNLLLMFSASAAGTNLAKSTLKLALDFELYETALFCAKVLRKQFSYRGEKDEYYMYNSLVEKYHQLTYSEDKTAEYLECMYVNQVNINIFKPETIELARDYLTRTENIFSSYPSYINGLHYFRLRAIYECLCHDYESALQTWTEFEIFLVKYKNYEYTLRLGESALQQLYCHLCMGDYQAGKQCAIKCENLFQLHSNNWFIYKEYYFLLLMHTRNYDEAWSTIQLINSIPHFKQLNTNRQEKWKIFEAYSFIVQKAMSKAKGHLETQVKNFKMSKFLNEIPIYNKDKEGFNTAVLIIQIMLLLLEQKFTKLPDKMEALKRYANRYFKKEEVYKSHTFMKMLILADRNNYDKAATIQRTNALGLELKKRRYAYANTYDGIEIVPYADLWGFVLNSLTD